jgi:hypothetical protein
MTYTTAEGRQQLLDTLARGIQEIGDAMSALGEAHELLDEQSAERLEDSLFAPTQRAYALARRTHAEFAARCGLQSARPQPSGRGAPSHGAKGFLEHAVEATGDADATLAELQDSLLPVEVGDPQLRAGLSSVRELLGGVTPAARAMLRTLGR